MSALSAACPCGGHAVALAPDMPPVGGRATFTCPACGKRMTFTRTPDGAVFDPLPTAAPQPPVPAPRPDAPRIDIPAGARLALLAVTDAAWLAAAEALFPAPQWFVPALDSDPGQAAAVLASHAPEAAVIEDRPEAAPILAAIAAWTGRQRETLALLLLADAPDNDPLAAFAASADVVLDRRVLDDAAGRLAAALDRAKAAASLFDAPRGS